MIALTASSAARTDFRSMRLRALIASIALLTLGATPKGMAPLPAQYLKGHTFTSPDGWFTVTTPPGNWEWFEMREFDGDADPRWPTGAHSMVAWYIRNPETHEHFTLLESYDPLAGDIDETFINALETGTRNGLTKDETMSNFSIARVRVPTADSIRFSYRIHTKSGDFYRFAYVDGAEHKVFLQTSSDTPVESKTYDRFVVSLRWLKTP